MNISNVAIANEGIAPKNAVIAPHAISSLRFLPSLVAWAARIPRGTLITRTTSKAIVASWIDGPRRADITSATGWFGAVGTPKIASEHVSSVRDELACPRPVQTQVLSDSVDLRRRRLSTRYCHRGVSWKHADEHEVANMRSTRMTASATNRPATNFTHRPPSTPVTRRKSDGSVRCGGEAVERSSDVMVHREPVETLKLHALLSSSSFTPRVKMFAGTLTRGMRCACSSVRR